MSSKAPAATPKAQPPSPADAALLSALKGVDDAVRKQKENEKTKDVALKEAKAKDLAAALGTALTLLRTAADVDAASAELRAKAFLSLAVRLQAADDSRRDEVNALLDLHRDLVPKAQLKMQYFVHRLSTFARATTDAIESMSPEYIQAARDLGACVDPDAHDSIKKYASIIKGQVDQMDKAIAKKRADEQRLAKQAAAAAKAADGAVQRASPPPSPSPSPLPRAEATGASISGSGAAADELPSEASLSTIKKKKKKKATAAGEGDPTAAFPGADETLLARQPPNSADLDAAGTRADEISPPARASEFSNEKYASDVRWQRFDVGRMLATPRAGSPRFALPRAWWDQWCAYVGGFSDAEISVLRDLHAHAGPGAVLRCTDPRVIAAFAPFPSALPSSPGACAAWAPTAARPGKILTSGMSSAAGGGDVGGVVKFLDEDVFLALESWYGLEGPRVPAGAPASADLLCSAHGSGQSTVSAGAAVAATVAAAAGLSTDTVSDAASDGDVQGVHANGAAPRSASAARAGGVTDGAASLATASLAPEVGRIILMCTRCGERAAGVSKCSSCKLAQYCTEQCQKADWSVHKAECKEKRAVPADRRSGRIGLNNMGNTCYMGAALQALSAVWPLSKFYVADEHVPVVDACRHNKLGTKGAMSDAYAELLKGLWYPKAGERSIFPTKMKTQAANFQSRFSGLAQHDAQELLSFVMDGLHEDTNRAAGNASVPLRDQLPGESDLDYGRESWRQYTSVNASRIVDLFSGQYKSTLRCPTCTTRSVKFDVFNIVTLPMPEAAFRFVPVILRRLPPALLGADACTVPTADAPARVKAAWDEIASFDKHFSRLVLRISMRGRPYVTGADVVAALASETGLAPQCINLFSTNLSMGIHSLLSPSMVVNLQSFVSFPASADGAGGGGTQPQHLFATECHAPAWRSPYTPADAAGEAAYVEAVALANRTPMKGADEVRAKVLALRPPSWRISCYVECYEPLFHAPQLARAPIKTDAKDRKDRCSIPLCVSLSLDTPHAVLRMHVAAALLPVAAEKRAALAAQLGCAPGARGHELLRALAAELDFYGEGKVALDSFSPVAAVAADAPTCATRIIKGIAPSAIGNAAKGPALDPDLSFLRVKLSLRPHVSFVNLDDFAAVIEDTTSVGDAAASLPHTPSDITTCFQQLFTEDEGLDADNMWKCPRCQVPVRATKDMEIWTLPDFVITMFKRFKAGGGYLPRKASQLVDFPLIGLDLTNFNGEAKAAAHPAAPLPSLYDAIAVVNHTGQLRGGHCSCSRALEQTICFR